MISTCQRPRKWYPEKAQIVPEIRIRDAAIYIAVDTSGSMSGSRMAAQWGERFPTRPVAFAAETPPAREALAQSRTMKGSGAAAAVATLGAAGVEVAQQVLAETQNAFAARPVSCQSRSKMGRFPGAIVPG